MSDLRFDREPDRRVMLTSCICAATTASDPTLRAGYVATARALLLGLREELDGYEALLLAQESEIRRATAPTQAELPAMLAGVTSTARRKP